MHASTSAAKDEGAMVLRMFYESLVTSAILYGVVCSDANRLNKLFCKISEIMGVELDLLVFELLSNMASIAVMIRAKRYYVELGTVWFSCAVFVITHLSATVPPKALGKCQFFHWPPGRKQEEVFCLTCITVCHDVAFLLRQAL